MKYIIIAAFIIGLAGCKGTPGVKSSLNNDKDKTSYALGLNLGKRLKTDSVEVNPELIFQGLRDALVDSSKKLLSDSEVKQVLATLDQGIAMKRMVAGSAVSEKNKKEGGDFLEQNKKRSGVTTLPSGLQYEVITEGKGKMPKADQTVQTNYRGMLIDGTEFDSSTKHGGPATFRVNQVIAGWTEALQRMRVGSKWKLYIPPQLAYGDRGAGGVIGPNATLVFEIELLSIK
jgi:FKBP-type peptidyl-prolyl cis-trans isomerase FklB